MLNKILRDSLSAELKAVEGLLAEAQAQGDFVGELQFEARLEAINREIEQARQEGETKASLAILFGGAPVFGSHGILADVAGRSLDALQEIVTKKFARAEHGDLGARGPVAGNRDARLMVTEVARGSFGFVLQEAGQQAPLVRTPLATIVDETAELISKLGSHDQEVFEAAVSDLDDRVLGATRKFFRSLDDAGATVRIVEGEHDFVLDRASVELARKRTEELEIDEQEGVELEGRLIGFLPVHRRFEFSREPGGEVIAGKVHSDAARDLQNRLQGDLLGSPIGMRWRARFHVRNVTARNAEPRTYYTLVGLVQNLQENPT